MTDDLHSKVGSLVEGMNWVKAELSEIKSDVKSLDQFKWRVAGGAAVLGVIIGSVSQVLLRLFELKGK